MITVGDKEYWTPDIVRAFIEDYDFAEEGREYPEPIEFELEKPIE